MFCASYSSHALELTPTQSIDNIFDHGVLIDTNDIPLGSPESVLAARQQLQAALQLPRTKTIGLIEEDSWIGVQLHNAGEDQGFWRLDTEMAGWVFATRAYFVQEDQVTLVFDTPGLLQFESNPVVRTERGQEVVASDVIKLESNESGVLLFHFRTEATSWERIRLLTLEDFSTNRVWQGQKFGVIFGANLILTLFFLVFSIVLRSRPAAYYAIFFGSTAALAMLLEGLWFSAVDFNAGSAFLTINMTTRLAAAIAYLQFMRSFLATKEHQPKLDKSIQYFCSFLVVLALWNIWQYSDASATAIVASMFVFSVYQIIGGVLAYRSNRPGTTLYLAGTLMVFCIVVFSILHVSDFIKISTRLGNDVTYLMSLFDGFIFATAIVTQALGLRVERDSAVQLADDRRAQLATASHDLRQPLMSLQLAVAELDDSDQATLNLRDQLNTGLRYLNSVVGENLQETHPDKPSALGIATPAATVAPKKGIENIEVEMLFTNLERMFAADARAKNLELRFRSSPLSVQGQAIDLIRILVNLTANAIKFTDEGGVLVAARQQNNSVTFQVWDTGRGFAAGTLNELKAAYQKGDSQQAGEGLGLAIVQDLADDNGYRLSINSRPGNGTVCSIKGVALA